MSETGWQPIETAPKDQPIILTDGVNIEVGKRSRWTDAWGAHTGQVPVWEGSDDRGGLKDVEIAPPIHWMPLPEPPQ